MKLKKRILALLAAGAMICSALPVNVLAEELPEQNTGGLCEHHQQHTAECGYSEGVAGTPCTHEHNEECFTIVTNCVHEHTQECYPTESNEEPTEPAQPTACTHECSEESGCITKELDCKHEHDSDCGYTEEVPGTPCNFVCEICNAQGEDKPAEQQCVCETLCTAETVNKDCPVCGSENADLTACKGKEADKTECICTVVCTAETLNKDCPVCGAEGADLTACKGKPADEAVKAVQAQIDALPTAEELEAMTAEEQQAVYEKLQAAYEAYNALTDEQKAAITGAEKMDNLFAFFEGKDTLATVNNVEYLDADGSKKTADNVTVVDSNATTWSDGWYVVNSDVTIASRVTVSGTVHLILADGAKLTVNDDINVAENNSFTVYAQSTGSAMGALKAADKTGQEAGIGGGTWESAGNITINGGNIEATGGWRAAGIGGGYSGSGGTVIINGGNVTATGGQWGAGIGGGDHGSGGNITINGGNIKATGEQYAAGIGGGDDGSGGTVIINGGNVTATGGQYGAGIGGGDTGSSGGNITINGGSVAANGGKYAAGIGGGKDGSGGSFTTGADGHALIIVNGGISDNGSQDSWGGIIFDGNDGKVYGDQTLQNDLEISSDKKLTVPQDTTLTVNSGVTLTNNGTIINNGTITNNGKIINNGTINGTIDGNQPMSAVSYLTCDENGQNWDKKECTSYTVVESNTTTWSNGWYVVNSNVTIDSRVTVSGEVHLILANGANLTVNNDIQVKDDNSFTVYAQSTDTAMGILTAKNTDTDEAGIGGGNWENAGTITINGGNVTATGGSFAAGIGGGSNGSGGTITINGGNVTATGGSNAAGIGGGYSGSGGKITVNGGKVTAKGGGLSAGIGSGFRASSGGDITINGGNVTATGNGGAGIGGGHQSPAGTIIITGGNVTANGGNEEAGIGSGKYGSGGSVTISGGTVTATGGKRYGAAGIGAGLEGSGVTFKTGADGHALIIANGGISDKGSQNSWGGIIFDGNNGQVYGDQTLQNNLEIPSGKTLTVPQNTTLTVNSGVTLICNTTLTNDGTIAGTGTLTGNGTLTGTGTVADTVQNDFQKDSAVTVTVNPSPVTYGSEITVTAKMSRATTTFAAANQVEFFVGTDSNKQSLGTANVSNDTAKLTLILSGDTWNKGFQLGKNTITAEFGGSMGLKENSGTVELTVNPSQLSAPQNPKWDSSVFGKATWGAVPNASGYSVQLYKDGKEQGSPISVKDGTTYTFANITEAGSYTFKVKATGAGNYTDSPESTASAALSYYTVTFETNGGSTIPAQIVAANGKATAPTEPTKTGHTFGGWYSDKELTTPYDFNNAVSQNTVVYAKWTADTYSVTLNANGGTIFDGKNIISYTYGVGATLPTENDIAKTGYTFAGWYEDSNFSGTPVTAISTTDIGEKNYFAKWLSADAGVQSVVVDGTSGTINGTTITVVLPYGTESLPTDSSKVVVTPATGATVSNLATTDNGKTWTFTVTAEDKQNTQNYTVNVSVAPDPAAGNRNDIAGAKSAVENYDWIVPQATANTEEAVKAWIEEQLAAMNLNGASYEVTVTSFTPAVEGTTEDRDGTNGSFAFTVKLYKGDKTGSVATSTYAEDNATVSNGTVTATPYSKWTVTLSAEGSGTVSGGGTFEENTEVTVTADPDSGYRFVRWLENGLEVSTDRVYSFTLTSNRNLTAVFTKKSSGGSSSGNGSSGNGFSSDNNNGGTTVDKEKEEYNDFWDKVIDRINKADEGDTVTVHTGNYDKVPNKVMKALEKNGVGLIIKYNGGEIEIPAGEAMNKSNKVYWTFKELGNYVLTTEDNTEPNNENRNESQNNASDNNTQTNTTTEQKPSGTVETKPNPQTGSGEFVGLAAALALTAGVAAITLGKKKR